MIDSSTWSDEMLLDELNRRLQEKNRLLHSQKQILKDLELLNEKLRQSEKVKSQFLSNIRNEINNPLTSVLGLSYNLISNPIELSRVKQCVSLIHQEIFNLDLHLKNIFAAAEIEAGEIRPEPVELNIFRFISEQVKYLEQRSQQKKISVNTIYDSEIQSFVTDPYLFQTILSNILANAIEYSHAGSEINLTVQKEGTSLIMKVQDYGIGISKEDTESIFQRFHQKNSSSTKQHQGLGLGLSIVKEFCDILLGDIQIFSEPGIQTTISVTLPPLKYDNLEKGFLMKDDDILFSDPEVL